MTATTQPRVPTRRRAVFSLLAVGCSAVVVALLLGLSVISPDGTVFDPGPVITFGLPVAKVVVDLSAAATIGALIVAGSCVARGSKSWDTLLNLTFWSAGLWCLASCGTAVLTSISLTGPVPAELFPSSLYQFFTQIAVGQAWLATILMTAVLAVLAFAGRSRGTIAVSVALAFATLMPLALQGHAAGAGNHVTATIALWLHICGAAAWVGGLVAVASGGRR
jgi:Putative copper export protein